MVAFYLESVFLRQFPEKSGVGVMSRRLARETALQVLFQKDLAEIDPAQALDFTCAEFAVPETSKVFASRLVSGTLAHLEEIDNMIRPVAKEWNIERMAAVDRNILRLAAYELFFCEDIPGNVTVNEAIELAKTFSGEDAGKFVNGILGVLVTQAKKPSQPPGQEPGGRE